jgi:hypothetical protein
LAPWNLKNPEQNKAPKDPTMPILATAFCFLMAALGLRWFLLFGNAVVLFLEIWDIFRMVFFPPVKRHIQTLWSYSTGVNRYHPLNTELSA